MSGDPPCSQDMAEHIHRLSGHHVRVEPTVGPIVSAPSHLISHRRRPKETDDAVGEGALVVRPDKKTIVTVLHEITHPAHVRSDDGPT